MKLTSSAFQADQTIPSKYTCDGEDLSPPLTFEEVPDGTVSFVLIVDDPDAPMGTFDHWIVWNISKDMTELSEGETFPMGGLNHFGEIRYRGPCPPRGPAHRYFFKVYALDTKLDLPRGSSKEEVQEAIKEHILDQAELIGLYQR